MPRILLAGEKGGYPALLKDALAGFDLPVESLSVGNLLADPFALADAALVLVEMRPGDASVPALCRRLRDLSDTPLVVFGGNLGEYEIVPALEAGADDILSLPMRPFEVSARLRAVLRRTSQRNTQLKQGRVVSGDIEVSLDEHKAYRRGQPLHLSPIELRLLTLLASEAGRPLSHAKLISHVWGPEYTDCRHYLRLYIRYLREKIEDEPHSPRIILNEWGTGYRLEPSQVA